MAERTVAFSCPEHEDCVAQLVFVPKSELAGRKPYPLSPLFQTWADEMEGVVIYVSHTPALPFPQRPMTYG